MTRKRSRAEVAAAVDAIVRADAARAAEFEPQPSEIERVLALVSKPPPEPPAPDDAA